MAPRDDLAVPEDETVNDGANSEVGRKLCDFNFNLICRMMMMVNHVVAQ